MPTLVSYYQFHAGRKNTPKLCEEICKRMVKIQKRPVQALFRKKNVVQTVLMFNSDCVYLLDDDLTSVLDVNSGR